jgi:hypothetical protein
MLLLRPSGSLRWFHPLVRKTHGHHEPQQQQSEIGETKELRKYHRNEVSIRELLSAATADP